MKILQINSSIQKDASVSHQLSNFLTEQLGKIENTEVTYRDLAKGIPLLDKKIMDAFRGVTPDTDEATLNALDLSNELVAELKETDVIIIGSPIYNFSIPASLKAYFDLVARAGLTFKYTQSGPQGLVTGVTAYVIFSSGGTRFQQDDDFASGYTERFLKFLGIEEVHFIVADQVVFDRDGQIKKAEEQIAEMIGQMTT